MKCPHCYEEIKSGASKCPLCTGAITYGDKSGNIYVQFVFGVVVCGGLVYWLDIGHSFMGKIAWVVGGSVALVIYTRYMLEGKGN